jgi:phosphoglycolate phosphatase
MNDNSAGANMSTERFRAVLFDMDGTLLYTLDDIALAGNRALAAQGFPKHPVADYRMFIGSGARNLIIRALPESVRNDVGMVDTCLKHFLEDYGLNWNVRTRPYPGMDLLLDGLTARKKAMAILTNKPHEAALKCAGELLGRWTFAEVLGQRPGRPIKPDPAGALEIAGNMGISPSEILYLGDSAVDMHTAVAAGMLPVGVLWGYRDREELVSAGARAVIARPEDLLRSDCLNACQTVR